MESVDLSHLQALPVGLVPTPTNEYRQHRKRLQTLVEPGPPRLGSDAPIPVPSEDQAALLGSRVLIYKQDPSVSEIGVRKSFLPGVFLSGPRDARVASGSPGIPPVEPNAFGDFIQVPGTDAFDGVHAYAVVRQTLRMYQRALAVGGSAAPLPWQWNSGANTEPLNVFPHGLPDVMNAFYSRSAKALKFGHFIRSGTTTRVFTCRSFDIVAHETGHAILDGLKPDWIVSGGPQTGGLHESFGDISAIFVALSQLDQVEAVIAQTKGNLHDKTFLADLAEEFGLALGRPTGLRNADNDLKLSETGTEVHAISQVFTGAIYDILADLFNIERKTAVKDDAATLYEVSRYLLSLLIRAIIAAPASNVSFADVANQMLTISVADVRPVEYQKAIRNRFTVREVVASPTPLTVDFEIGTELMADVTDEEGAVQNRAGCCGTMNNQEFLGLDRYFDAERKTLAAALKGSTTWGPSWSRSMLSG
jgi:hypothetical protein